MYVCCVTVCVCVCVCVRACGNLKTFLFPKLCLSFRVCVHVCVWCVGVCMHTHVPMCVWVCALGIVYIYMWTRFCNLQILFVILYLNSPGKFLQACNKGLPEVNSEDEVCLKCLHGA